MQPLQRVPPTPVPRLSPAAEMAARVDDFLTLARGGSREPKSTWSSLGIQEVRGAGGPGGVVEARPFGVIRVRRLGLEAR